MPRYGSGDWPSVPDYSPGGESDVDIMTVNRDDDEYAREQAEKHLHAQDCD